MSDPSLVNGLRADLHEFDCPGMDEDGNWLGPCACAEGFTHELTVNSRPDGSYRLGCTCGAGTIQFVRDEAAEAEWHRRHLAGEIPGQEPVQYLTKDGVQWV